VSLIAGYYSKDGKYDTAAVERMVQSYSILSRDDSDNYENIVIETKFGHIIQKQKRNYPIQCQPRRDQDGNLLVTLGWCFHENKIINDPHLFELCLNNSPSSLEECEGEFVSIFVTGHSGKIDIVNDRFSSRPFYVFKGIDRIYFSSNLAFLLHFANQKQEIDIVGWFQVFTFGHTLESRTTFRDILRVKPSSHVTISTEGITERQYWRLEFKPDRNLDPISHSEDVFEAFKSAVEIRAKMGGEGIVALSGGIDSRLVAACLPEKAGFSAFTFVDSTETSDTKEVKAAAQICKILNLQHHIQPTRELKMSEFADDVILLTGGLRPIHHPGKAMLYVSELKRLGINFLLGGAPAGMAGRHFQSLRCLDPLKNAECVQLFCDGFSSKTHGISLLFRKDILMRYANISYQSLLASFDSVAGQTAAHRITAWFLINRWPAFVFTSPIHDHPDVTEAFGHLDYRYSDLMLKQPAAWLYQKNFYSFMIYHCLPQLREVVYANTGKRLSGQFMSFKYRSSLMENLKSSGKHTLRRLFPKASFKKGLSKPFLYSLYRNDENLFKEIAETIQSHHSLREMLDEKKCMTFLGNFKDGRRQTPSYNNDVELLGSLAAICYGARKFQW
jgi:hypothetical protein